MKNQVQKYIITFIFTINYLIPVMADPNDPDADQDPVPIDGWIFLLFIAAVIVSIYFQKRSVALN